jgi:hypothetical protein
VSLKKLSIGTVRRPVIMTRTKLALSAVLMLAVGSAAQAGSKDDADPTGGYKVGPLGQIFQTGVASYDNGYGYYPGYYGSDYGYASGYPRHTSTRRNPANHR